MAKSKGTNVLQCVKALRRQRDRARAVLPGTLHSYLEERIHEPAWYPEEDLLGLMRGVARLLEGAGLQVYEEMGRQTARAHLEGEGVYKHLLADGDPVALARRGLALWGSLHDTGRFRLELEGPGRARIELSEFGFPSTELCRVTTGYMGEVFRLSGLEGAEVKKSGCVVTGEPLCTWDCRWREDSA